MSSELQSAGDEKDLTLWTPKNFKQVFGTTLGNVLKGGNGFSTVDQKNPTGEDYFLKSCEMMGMKPEECVQYLQKKKAVGHLKESIDS